jgi:ubiquinone/menaquinone biosynthesis C-methylase UbiE
MNHHSQDDYSGDYFRSRFTVDTRRDAIWQEIVRYLAHPYIPPEAKVLDVGAGYCSFINQVQAAERYALDLFPQIGDYAAPGVKTFVGSCTHLHMFGDGQLDVVFSSNVLEHLTRLDTDSTLREILRVLKPGGHYIIIQPNFRYCYRAYFDDYTHLQIFTDIGLGDWLTARGFEIARVIPRFLPFSFKSRLPKAPWLARLYLQLPYRPLAKQMLIVARKPLG